MLNAFKDMGFKYSLKIKLKIQNRYKKPEDFKMWQKT